MKKAALLLFVSVIVISLASCSGGISTEEAKGTLQSFVECIASEKYGDAAALMHPAANVAGEELTQFVGTLESSTGADFSAGTEITGYTGFHISFYDSDVAGSRYELAGNLTAGTAELVFTVIIVRNDDGFGIYNINFNTAE